MRVNINGQAAASVLINGNTLRQCPNGRGIEVIGRNGTGGLDVTVTGNDVNPQDTSYLAAILVQSNCLTTCNTVRSELCVVIRSRQERRRICYRRTSRW